jgi:prepilin-type N-terminal cleavage/methylation domain-containing protein
MKKLNNKGFTLVELLAVIVILIIITAIAIPSISSSIERTNDSQRKAKEESILSAAELYLSDHKTYREEFYGGYCYIKVDSLVPNYIDDEATKYNNERVGNYVYYKDSKIQLSDSITGGECS